VLPGARGPEATAAVLLQGEDFRDFPVGEFPSHYGAHGEYHYWPIQGYRGRWYEPTIKSRWRNPHWMVIESGGEHLMVQSTLSDDVASVLVTGDAGWADYAVSCTIRPLSLQGPCGLAGRYQDSRNYYSLSFDGTGTSLQLLKHAHEGQSTLAETPFPYDCDSTYRFQLRVAGDRLTGAVDGVERLRATDGAYARGRVALWAVCPTRFGRVQVETTPEARRFFVQRLESRERELAELRERNPRPVLWKAISTTGFGTGRHIRFGDLDGDGRLEMVLAQNVKMIDGGNYGMISCLTALDLEGNVRWRIGEPSATPGAGTLTADLPFQIYDLDGDGQAEVVYCRDYMINVADGRTGELKYQAPTPVAVHPQQFVLVPDDPTYRITGDSLAFANLRGRPRAADLLLKNRYNQIWAYDDRLNLLWTHEHNTGHFLRVTDLDGDGRDEVMSGYTLLDGDGRVRWQHTHFVDHADEIAIGPFDPDRADVQIAQAAGEDGFLIFGADGDLLVQDHVGHVQRVSVAKYRPDVPGLQYYVVTYWGNAGIIVCYDAKGRRLHSLEPASLGNVLSPVNWTGDGQELALLNPSVRHGGLLDGWGRRVVLLPDDGHPDLCAEALDLTGDARDELVVWDRDRIFIYTQDRPFRGERIYAPIRLPHHNMSNYRADESLPAWQTVAP
jgi:rhamnogalacturonan endolyase